MRSSPTDKRDAIVRAIMDYAADPFAPHPNVKPMAGQRNLVRLRVGNYRVILHRGKDVIEIRAVGTRGGIYS